MTVYGGKVLQDVVRDCLLHSPSCDDPYIDRCCLDGRPGVQTEDSSSWGGLNAGSSISSSIK